MNAMRKVCAVIAMVWPLLACSNAAAQSKPVAAVRSGLPVPETLVAHTGARGDETSFTITKRVDEVRLLFTAADRHGRFVTQLGPDDLTLMDDNKPPAAIINFHRETDMPLVIGLVLDTSGSVRQRWPFEQEAALAFLRHVLRPEQDSAYALGFSSKVHMAHTMTNDVGQLQTSLAVLRPGGGTALFDAIAAACGIQAQSSVSNPRRKMVIVISDGEDNQSRISIEQAIEQAKRAEVTIYAISTNDSSWVKRGDHILERLANETGGRAFFPSKLKDLTRAFVQIEQELRSQYVIAYKPAEFRADGHYRTIRLWARNPHLSLRSRSGYYAPLD